MDIKKDSYYINRILSGYTSDFSIIVDKYRNMVYTIAYRIAGNHEDAEELAQDVFIKAYNSLKDFKGRSKFSTWLYSITYNASVSKIRKKQLDYVSIDDSDSYYPELNDKTYEEDYNLDKIPVHLLKKMLDDLNSEDRLLLTLYYQDNRSIKELADISGLSVANVKVKLFRTRKKIYQKLKDIYKEEITNLL